MNTAAVPFEYTGRQAAFLTHTRPNEGRDIVTQNACVSFPFIHSRRPPENKNRNEENFQNNIQISREVKRRKPFLFRCVKQTAVLCRLLGPFRLSVTDHQESKCNVTHLHF